MPEIVREGILLVLLAESKLLLVIFANVIPEKKYISQINSCVPHTRACVKLLKQIRIILHFDSSVIFTVNPDKTL